MFPQAAAMTRPKRLMKVSDIPAVKAWWTATSRVVKSGINIAAWRDQITNCELSTAGGFWFATGMNGHPGIQLTDGVYFTRADLPPGTPVSGAEGWVFQLIKQGPAVPDGEFQTSFSLGSGNFLYAYKSDDDHKHLLSMSGASIDGFATTTDDYDVEAFHYCEGSSPRTFTAWKNDIEGGHYTTTVSPAPGPLTIGRDFDGGNYARGLIGDFIITGPLTELQQQQLVAILLWSVGKQANLPGGSPFATIPPYI